MARLDIGLLNTEADLRLEMNEYPFKKYNFVLFNQIGVKIIRLHVKVGSEVRVHEKICPCMATSSSESFLSFFECEGED